MDAFSYLGDNKFNDFQMKFPSSSDIFDGTRPSLAPGILGDRHQFDKQMAIKLSNTNIGTLGEGRYQVVRSDPAIATVGNWSKGRPVFWSSLTDKTKQFMCTTVASATSILAGIALNTLTLAGNVMHICTYGDCEGLWAAASAKVVPIIGDPLQLKIAANLADLEVILDATSWTNVQVKAQVGRVLEVPANPAASGIKRIFLNQAFERMQEGIM